MNRTRSNKGVRKSIASCRTRSLNSSDSSSRLRNSDGNSSWMKSSGFFLFFSRRLPLDEDLLILFFCH